MKFPRWAAPAKGRCIANLLELRAERKSPRPFASIKRPDGQTKDNLGRKAAHRLRDAQRHREKVEPRDFKNIRKGGIIAIQIEEGRPPHRRKLTSGHDEIVLITQKA